MADVHGCDAAAARHRGKQTTFVQFVATFLSSISGPLLSITTTSNNNISAHTHSFLVARRFGRQTTCDGLLFFSLCFCAVLF